MIRKIRKIRKINSKKIIILALFTAVSLVLFVVEMQIPPLSPVPGIKLGLANIVTLFILYKKESKPGDAFLVIIARVLLASLITGNLSALFFSFTGGIAAICTMLLFKKIFKAKLIPVTSVAGAISHNVTQAVVAVLVYNSKGILLYIPVLIFGGILSGLLTGFTAEIIIKRLRR